LHHSVVLVQWCSPTSPRPSSPPPPPPRPAPPRSTLAEHPTLQQSNPKNPEFYSNVCRWKLSRCGLQQQSEYLRTALRLGRFVSRGGIAGHFEASTHYVRNGDRMVAPLKESFPWVKVLASLREPISRAASMLIHKKDKSDDGCLMKHDLPTCLLQNSQIHGDSSGARAANYSFPMRAWVEGWPSDQLHVIQVRAPQAGRRVPHGACGRTTRRLLPATRQPRLPAPRLIPAPLPLPSLPRPQYEELTSDEGERKELRRLKKFLDADPDLPKGQELGVANARRFKIKPEGWPMKRWQYEALVALVRPDAEETAALLEKGGQIPSARTFLERWERVWDDNLASCDAKDDCKIQLS
jgi:hypothetical protein